MTTRPAQNAELPSTRALIRSTVIAALVATGILVTIVLPAEHGRDPTGVGRLLGLTQMGEIKTSLSREVAAEESARAPIAAVPCPPAAPPPVATSPPEGSAAPAVARPPSHVTRVTLKPGEGKEVKLLMRKGARATFAWSTDAGVVNYDLHADAPGSGAYHGYGKGQGARAHEGELVAAFDGMHGWFWRNRTKAPLTITLTTTGDYQDLKELE